MSEKLHLRIIKKKINKAFLLNPPKNDKEIKEIQMLLDTSANESALMISILISALTVDENLDAKDFKNRYNLTDKEYFEIFGTMQSLDKRGLIHFGSRYHNSSVFYPYLEVSKQSAESVLHGVGTYDNINKSDPYAWIDRYDDLVSQCRDDKVSYETYCNILNTDIENMDDSIKAKAVLKKMSSAEKSLLMYVLCSFATEKKRADANDYVRNVMGSGASAREKSNILEASLSVFKSGLIHTETTTKGFDKNSVYYFPSITAQSIYFGEDFIRNKYINVDFANINSIFGYFDELQVKLNDSICKDSYLEELINLISMIDDKLPLKSYINKLNYDEINILFVCINEYLNSESGVSLNDILENTYKHKADIKRASDNVLNDKMKFLKDGMVEKQMERSFFSSSLKLTLTPKGIRKLLQINPEIKTGENAMVSVLKSSAKANLLHFPGELKAEIDVLTDALSPNRYKSLIHSLNTNGFSKGFVCLFYGAPGTGKTAVCKEIARITKREIVQVDISRIRDMYVGESEKRLKQVFNEYYALKYQMKSTPILLFNEADALIGRRISLERSVDQMNNSMQNILLEELEKFDGIFMATTNLIDNLDDAFSRRFLYKIKFKKPDSVTRKLIWTKYMPELKEDVLEQVSGKELSGGQIENIAKKYHVERLLKIDCAISLGEIIDTEIRFKKKDNIMGFNCQC